MEMLYYEAEAKQELVLIDENYKHIKALRLKIDESILVGDGNGNIHTYMLKSFDKTSCKLEFVNTQFYEKPPQSISLAIGNLSDKTRLEFAIEKAVELGVSQIIIFFSQYCQDKRVNLSRLESKIISAIKQSHQAYKPTINSFTFNNLIEQIPKFDKIILLDIDGQNKINLKNTSNILLIIGPEGGLSSQEIEIIGNLENSQKFKLGSNRLRAETAAIASLSYFRFRLGP